MANLKEIRARIVSVGSTQQITKAMKMVSAAKLRRAQNAIVQLRPYSNKLNAMLSNLLSNTDGDSSSSFGVKRSVENVCIVVVTSNRGLCGAFNSNVIKSAVATINENIQHNWQRVKLRFYQLASVVRSFSKNVILICL
jgi:F-type H+-transporting ATPase subunit gamma